MKCPSCSYKYAYKLQITLDKKGNKKEVCDKCGNLSSTWIPDVFWDGNTTNPNITDKMGDPIPFYSRQQKANVLRSKGMSEAGDRVHGSYVGTTRYQVMPQRRKR
jgi:hypothetical protein